MRYPYKIIAIFIFLIGSAADADQIPKQPSSYVVDLAAIVDDKYEMRLNGILQELEQKTTAQFLVVTIRSLEGIPIDTLTLQIAEKWKLGHKSTDNGLLFLISAQDKKYRFEVGYGLEGILPDSLVGSIGRQAIQPAFKRGSYTEGIVQAVATCVNHIAEAKGVSITGMPKLSRSNRKTSPFATAVSILIGIGLVVLFIRHPRLFLLFLIFGMGGRRGSWGGGGGSGGFGSFGGGGGGGFGGGGASGSW